MLDSLVKALEANNNPAQVWTSPSMHALYTFAYHKASNDWDAYPLKDVSRFPYHYLWLLWSPRWIREDGFIPSSLNSLYNLMSQAITDPSSNYQPKDAILSVEHFVASSGVIEEAELRVAFDGLAHSVSLIINDPAKLLFLASLTLKLCQQSSVSAPKMFSLLIAARTSFDDPVRVICIFPLLCSLFSKAAPHRDNAAVHATEIIGTIDEISPELDAFIEDVCSQLELCRPRSHFLAPEPNPQIVSVLSLLPALSEPSLTASEIIRRLPEDVYLWRGAFEYLDRHGKIAYLYPLMMLTSECAADSSTRQQQARLIPILSKQLNELDSTFQLPEGPYTFEHERQARELMEAAYAAYVSSSGTANEPQAIVNVHSSSTDAADGAVQEGSGIEGAGGDPGDVVIDIGLPVDTPNTNGGEADGSEVVMGSDQPDIP
jgi:hypothetical protein